MQINRLFEIVYLLLETPHMTAQSLARRFEVSTRTIYRDIETLTQAGIPLYMTKGKGGGISLLPDFVLDKTVLTEQERQEILSSMKAVSAVSLLPDDSALSKLSALLGRVNSDWIEADFTAWGYFSEDEDIFSRLKTAILGRKVVSFLYASSKSEQVTRDVYPLKLLFKGSAWYLYGFCTLRQEPRYFKLRRIKNMVITEQHFEMEAPEHLLQPQKLQWDTYIRCCMHISSEMAYRVYDEMNDAKVLDNGSFICTLFMPDIDSICTYAASFGSHCTILEPPEAVEHMKKRLKDTLKNYRKFL